MLSYFFGCSPLEDISRAYPLADCRMIPGNKTRKENEEKTDKGPAGEVCRP